MRLPGFLQRIIATPASSPEQQAAEAKRMQECGERIAAILDEYGYDLAAVAQIQIVSKVKVK